MPDVYNANTGEPINNGASVVKIPHGDAQSYTVRAYHNPEIADLTGAYSDKWKYPRFYTGDTND